MLRYVREASFAIVVLACAASALPACKRRTVATEGECAALLQKYFDLLAQGDARFKTIPPSERDELLRQTKAERMSTDPEMRRAIECKTVTRAEYDCAIKTTTTRGWNDCLRAAAP